MSFSIKLKTKFHDHRKICLRKVDNFDLSKEKETKLSNRLDMNLT